MPWQLQTRGLEEEVLRVGVGGDLADSKSVSYDVGPRMEVPPVVWSLLLRLGLGFER